MVVVGVEKLSVVGNYHRLDAEFYQPQYFIDFSKGQWEPVKKSLVVCQYGISQAMIEEPKGPPIFRMDDIKDCFLVNDEVKYIEIPEQVFRQFRLENNDILFNRVNAEEFVGRTGIFKLKGDYVFASYLVRLRVKHGSRILPDYLNIFLNTKFGKRQIHRFLRRAVNQANVNAEELKNFNIAIIPKEIQKATSQLSNEAWEKIELSKSLYNQAENLIMEELGLPSFKPMYNLSHVVSMSEAFGAHRLDAEYFDPCYDTLVSHINKKGSYTIKELEIFNKRGIQPEYSEDGEIKIVTSRHLGRTSIDYENLDTTTTDEWNNNVDAQIMPFDILIYTTGAYVGRTNCFLENDRALGSNHINILRVRKSNPLFVSVFLNSILGQMQVTRSVSGSAQAELYPSEISKFVIWNAPTKIQQRIAELVLQSHEARKKAKGLLEEAKITVEKAIEMRICS